MKVLAIVSYVAFGLAVAVLYPILCDGETYDRDDTPPALLVVIMWPLFIVCGALWVICMGSEFLGKGIMRLIGETYEESDDD